MRTSLTFVMIAVFALMPPARASDSSFAVPALAGVGFTPRLDAPVPLDVVLRDEYGNPQQLKEYFNGRPVVLTLVYYTCPVLCDASLEALASGLDVLSVRAGVDYEVVALSFNASETPADALQEKRELAARYPQAGSAGWRLLTGDETAIRALTEAAGFRFRYDPVSKTYAHASGALVLTPEGRISRYLAGVEYAPRDLKLALADASQNRMGTLADRVIQFCYQYDPRTGRYSLSILRAVQAGGVLTLIALVAMMIVWGRKYRNTAINASVAAAQIAPGAPREH